MNPQIMTSTDDRKIIDINGKPFIIPDNQLTDKSEMIKCEFYMLSDDLEFLIQLKNMDLIFQRRYFVVERVPIDM